LSFLTLTNRHYAVEWIANLPDTNWAALTNGIPGSATTQTVTDPATSLPARFYRLKVTTPSGLAPVRSATLTMAKIIGRAGFPVADNGCRDAEKPGGGRNCKPSR
jgi:hypothetical protein